MSRSAGGAPGRSTISARTRSSPVQGETDPAKLEQEQGLNCSTATDPALCLQVIDNMIANNKYGTATSLGGFSRLRSYPQGRYKGAHTEFYRDRGPVEPDGRENAF